MKENYQDIVIVLSVVGSGILFAKERRSAGDRQGKNQDGDTGQGG